MLTDLSARVHALRQGGDARHNVTDPMFGLARITKSQGQHCLVGLEEPRDNVALDFVAVQDWFLWRGAAQDRHHRVRCGARRGGGWPATVADRNVKAGPATARSCGTG